MRITRQNVIKNMHIKIFEKLLKTRNDSQTRSFLNPKGHNSLPKLMTREQKSQPKVDKDGFEIEKHIFQINRFNEDENLKFTEIIKRFIPSDKQSALASNHSRAHSE